MNKKELKFKIYKHECVECGHSTWRDFVIEKPVCVQCQSTKPPNIIEDVLVKEVVINDTYTSEDYAQAKRIAQEIIDGKPLEEIKGLELDVDFDSTDAHEVTIRALPPFFRMVRSCVRRGSFARPEVIRMMATGRSRRLSFEPTIDQPAKDNYY
jgi:hypothetical protein